MKDRLAPVLKTLLSEQATSATSNAYWHLWGASADGYLLTRKAVVAAATEDLPPVMLKPIRGVRDASYAERSQWYPVGLPLCRSKVSKKPTRRAFGQGLWDQQLPPCWSVFGERDPIQNRGRVN